MLRIAIDLLWVRHKKVGGTESCVRNLLNGIVELNSPLIIFLLLVSKDNQESFSEYKDCACFDIHVCDVQSENRVKRVLWQNFCMGKVMKELGIDVCLKPGYDKPFLGTKNIKFYTTIHDLQAMHYPEYFNILRVLWMHLAWKNAVKSSYKVIAISNYVREDIENYYPEAKGKTEVIYDAIDIDKEDVLSQTYLQKYHLEKEKYYYTVSSLYKHKNLETAILTIAELKRRNSAELYPLVISGIGGAARQSLDNLINTHDLKDYIIFTDFVNDNERNTLYKYCKAFLFSSIFEGFGMPPIEALIMGTPVLTTRCTCLPEVTEGLCNYVDAPLNPNEWANKLESGLLMPNELDVEKIMRKYNRKEIAEKYVSMFLEDLQ